MKNDRPLFIDFEASSLGPTSYPIEAGFSDPEAGAPISLLINPYAVEDWTDWDLHAQNSIHCISREQLREQGRHPVEVAEQMNCLFDGRSLYCDGGDFDRHWCHRLFEAANCTPLFRIDDVEELWAELLRGQQSLKEYLRGKANGLNPDWQVRRTLLEELAWQRTPGPRHRAANDVAYLEQLYQLIVEET
jgi:hypothetical protein